MPFLFIMMIQMNPLILESCLAIPVISITKTIRNIHHKNHPKHSLQKLAQAIQFVYTNSVQYLYPGEASRQPLPAKFLLGMAFSWSLIIYLTASDGLGEKTRVIWNFLKQMSPKLRQSKTIKWCFSSSMCISPYYMFFCILSSLRPKNKKHRGTT